MDLIVNNTATSHDDIRQRHRLLGRLLIEADKLSERDVQKILKRQQKLGCRFGEAAVALGKVKRADVLTALSVQFDYPLFEGSEHLDARLTLACDPFSARAEGVRELRNQLQLRWFAQSKSLLTVCSAHARESCSEVAANLALAFAQTGTQTLLIDADLRQSDMHKLFALPGGRGLSDILARKYSMQECLKTCLGFEHFSLLPAGTPPPNPLELLNRPTFAELLLEATARYDVILLNTPPTLDYADAQMIASLTGAALLIARHNFSRIGDIRRVQRQFGDIGIHLLGAAYIDCQNSSSKRIGPSA